MTPSAVLRPRNRNKKKNVGFIAPRFDSANAKIVAEDAFNKISGGANDIHVDSVGSLMKSLGFFQEKRNRGRDLVVALGQMGQPSSSITKSQFTTWYINNVATVADEFDPGSQDAGDYDIKYVVADGFHGERDGQET